MARIRTIKPETWSSEQVVDCCRDARLLFIGMLNFADDNGVLKFRARTIKSNVFPEDEDITSETIRRLIVELVKNGLLGIYEAQGSEYIHILEFRKHQRIEKPTYKYPAPPKNPAAYIEWSSIDRRPTSDLFDDHSTPEGNGREGNGREVFRSKSNDRGAVVDGIDPDAGFDEFYAAYPRRAGRGQAEKAYRAAVRSGATPAELLTGAKRYAAEKANDDPKFTKHPATWLNGKCWLDSAQPSANAQPSIAPAPAVDIELWRTRMGSYSRGVWSSMWGPKPGEPGCEVPAALHPPSDAMPDIPGRGTG